MNKNEEIQMVKNEALNKIRKLYHPLHKTHYDNYSGESYAEQRESTISYTIEEMVNKIEKIKEKHKENHRKKMISKVLKYFK